MNVLATRRFHRGERREDLRSLTRSPAVEANLRGHLRHLFPDLPSDVPLRCREVHPRTAHQTLIVETLDGAMRQLFVKGPLRPGVVTPQSLGTEMVLLRDVAPRIWTGNPSTRCPRLAGYDADRGFLAIEMIEGASLESVIFGRDRAPARDPLPGLLRLTGGSLDQGVTSSATGAVFCRYADEGTYRDLCSVAQRLGSHYAAFRAPVCLIHGTFLPHHMLVQDGRVYVIDLAESRKGYPYLDLATFMTSYDVRLPWRRRWGAKELALEAQVRCFVDGYASHMGAFAEPEAIILRLAHLLSLADFCRKLFRGTWSARLQSWMARPWLQHRFRVVCRAELGALRAAARAA